MSNKIKKLVNHMSGRTSALYFSKIEEDIKLLNEKTHNLEKRLNTIEQLIRDGLYNSEEERGYLSSEYIFNALPRSQKKKILVCGYYGARNCGDELMLQAILKNVDTDKYDVTILLSVNHSLDSSYYYPYHVLHYPKKVDDCRYLAENYDAIVWGGGAVLDDSYYEYRGVNNDLAYILFTITLLMLRMQKEAYIFGVSANRTLQNKKAIQDLQYIVNNATYFSLRDTNSKSTLESAGIVTSNIDIIDDLALSLDFSNSSQSNKNGTTINIGAVLMSTTRDDPGISTIIKNIALAGRDYYKSKRIHLRLIPFFDQYHFDNELYSNAIKNIDDASMDGITITIEEQDFSPATISRVFSECDIIVSMRYHATLIAGGVLNRKVLSINQGNTHRHYYNKQKYIKDKYVKNLIEIPYEDSLNYEKLAKKLVAADRTNPKGMLPSTITKTRRSINAKLSKYLG